MCRHDYENANCTNCANGLPSSAYECAKTQGRLKEYCHERAKAINLAKYNDGYRRGYEQGWEEAIDKVLSNCEQHNYTCNSKEFAKVIREQLKEQKNV